MKNINKSILKEIQYISFNHSKLKRTYRYIKTLA